MKIWSTIFCDSEVSYTDNIKIYRQTFDEGVASSNYAYMQEHLKARASSMIMQIVQEFDVETLATTCSVVAQEKRQLPKILELNKRAAKPAIKVSKIGSFYAGMAPAPAAGIINWEEAQALFNPVEQGVQF